MSGSRKLPSWMTAGNSKPTKEPDKDAKDGKSLSRKSTRVQIPAAFVFQIPDAWPRIPAEKRLNVEQIEERAKEKSFDRAREIVTKGKVIEVHESDAQGKPTYNAKVKGSDPTADAWEVYVTWEENTLNATCDCDDYQNRKDEHKWCKHGVSVVAVLCNLSKLPTKAAAKKAEKVKVEKVTAKKKKIEEGVSPGSKGNKKKTSEDPDIPKDPETGKSSRSKKLSSNMDLRRITATVMYEWANEVIACQKRGGEYKDSMTLQEEEAAKELPPPEPRAKKLAKHRFGAGISKGSNSNGGRHNASSLAKDIIMSDEDYRKLLAPPSKKNGPQRTRKPDNAEYLHGKLQKVVENSAEGCKVFGSTETPEEAQTISLQDEALMLLLESDSETDESQVKSIETKPEIPSASISTSKATGTRNPNGKRECTLDELLDF